DALAILALDMSEDEALQFMKENDVNAFILFPDGHQDKREETTPWEFSELAKDADENAKFKGAGIQLSFRHIGILNAIYEALSYDERSQMNNFMAKAFENLFIQGNDNVLPSVEFHYSRTGDIAKIIHYRDMLGGRQFVEVDKLKSEFEPLGKFFDSINYNRGATELYNGWCQTYHGDYESSLAALEALEQRIDSTGIGPVNAENAEILSCAFLWVALFFDPSRSMLLVPEVQANHIALKRWNDNEMARIIRAMSLVAAYLKKIRIQMLAYWAMLGFSTMALILQGRPTVAARRLKLKLHSRKRKADIEYLRLLGGVLNGLVGTYSKRDQAYKDRAAHVFRDIGAPVHLRWVES
ncbi:hypothetical protein HK101_004055, partial [Irineochytrium annulatum]